MSNWIDVLSRGGQVRRWHTVPGLNQTVAEHSWRCALLAEKWGTVCDNVDTGRVLQYMLIHDIPEGDLGDMPWGAKQDPKVSQALKSREIEIVDYGFPMRHATVFSRTEFTESERLLSEVVDQAEAAIFITEQVNRGRRDLTGVRDSILDLTMHILFQLAHHEPHAVTEIRADIHKSTGLMQ